MSNQIETEEPQIEEQEAEPEDEDYQRPTKVKRNVKPLSEDEKERRRNLLAKAREKKKHNKEELMKYREQEKSKVQNGGPTVPTAQVLKPEKKKKQTIVKEIVKEEYETESDEEQEIVERVIVKKVPRPKKELNQNDMISLTYRERLQQQLKEEKMRLMMSSLFDY